MMTREYVWYLFESASEIHNFCVPHSGCKTLEVIHGELERIRFHLHRHEVHKGDNMVGMKDYRYEVGECLNMKYPIIITTFATFKALSKDRRSIDQNDAVFTFTLQDLPVD